MEWANYVNSAYCLGAAIYYISILIRIRGLKHPILTQGRKNLLFKVSVYLVFAAVIIIFRVWWILIVPVILDTFAKKIFPDDEQEEDVNQLPENDNP